MDRGEKKGVSRCTQCQGLLAHVPGVQRLIAEKRAELGDAWVNECWRRGMAGEPGWFFAREGAVALGTPRPEAEPFVMTAIRAGQALVVFEDKPPQEGQTEEGASGKKGGPGVGVPTARREATHGAA